jgi:hypothetical protein
MNGTTLAQTQFNNRDKKSTKLQLRSIRSVTDKKFDAWIMTVEDRWIEEIAACLEGNFPDWRS